jgi:hypothetical protein
MTTNETMPYMYIDVGFALSCYPFQASYHDTRILTPVNLGLGSLADG